MVRAHAACEEGVAIEQEVVGGDRRGDVGRRGRDELCRLSRRDVLEHDPKRGKRCVSGASTRSRKTRSRSKMSTAGSVTSPWTSSGMPQSDIASSTA